MEEKYPIRPEWTKYYNRLEAIRKSGVTNMYGAVPYLVSSCNIDVELATEILANWIQNYTELNRIYNWRNS